MSNRQISLKENNSVNANVRSLINSNTFNDTFVNSNITNDANIQHILKMYANELYSADDHKSDYSHINKDHLLHHKTGQTSNNTYLTSMHHSSNIINSINENQRLPQNNNYGSCILSMENNIANVKNSFCLSSPLNDENKYTQTHHDEQMTEPENAVISNNIHDKKHQYNSIECGNNRLKSNVETINIRNNTDISSSGFYGYNCSLIKSCPNIISTCLNINSNKDDSKRANDFNSNRNPPNYESFSIKSQYPSLHSYNGNTMDDYPLSYSKVITNGNDETCTNISDMNNNNIQKNVQNDESENCINFSNLDGKEEINNQETNNKNCEFKNKSNIRNCRSECDLQRDSIKHTPNLVKNYSDCNIRLKEDENKQCYSENGNNNTKKDSSCYNKKPKCYSLDDIKKGKIEVPNIIFTKLPFNTKGDNAIDSYIKNNKLLNFMDDCNNSTNLILKYPELLKHQSKKIKVTPQIAQELRSKIGSSIIYDDEFDRKRHSPNVQNLQMGKVFEKHVFSMLKNKKELGKNIFRYSNKYKKYKYNNETGFWMSNIDKRRLINPEKNDSYITELVYEKNESYSEVMNKLMNCKNYHVIPPINDFYKDNNFYSLLHKEKMLTGDLNTEIATIMRRYDIDGVSNYKTISSDECITSWK
ncbi:hypothetical protein YYC_01334 [Plasmodium yoelii 17X]|uniref:Uncharacterized protein n=3 Tax=Plasmodium yoelii TaxID=5861 RepID=A0AAE9WUR3_PLAYO|nr:conserved Plasmodium protein, unknown function [Plasmodium yoelii]ETB61437.1 hypothetical protein YYC_01334 [Plasmodium yoelii 17X]WBY60768.1 hypothetical protein Py17XNL_001401040 [Plasmodium yoelii yoelii]CDU20544.1 conserved Plasmodium protein, unknown function [Plasmodium yoelii]VTZ81505.1 conserved Plasmodium protein, unknown function [Plasmodium yoelii]|eukprot:XP_731268.2 conserved Plasmodium protein, unknown function [Plasmodium yoelii]